MRDPVLPNPALQWTAIAPSSYSEIYKNLLTISIFGAVPSVKNN